MRQLLLGPFTNGEIPEDQTIAFAPVDKDYTGYVLSFATEKGGTPGNTGDGTDVTLTGTIEWLDQTKGVAYVRFADGDLVNEGTDPLWYLIQLWAYKSVTPKRKTATIAIGFYVEPAVGTGAPAT
ncbi:MAG: hypothetical protein DRJ50_12760 [Actinobacteria bacterium]|nr:MAG: hypothetical protein DRJ50_12760 [Actinomycetota bacterium]